MPDEALAHFREAIERGDELRGRVAASASRPTADAPGPADEFERIVDAPAARRLGRRRAAARARTPA